MTARRRNLVVRSDGRPVNVARSAASSSCAPPAAAAGAPRTGSRAVPTELYHGEWERRRLRNVVHLTIGGCLGPCALANVVAAPLRRPGAVVSLDRLRRAGALALYDHIEAMLEADACLPPRPPGPLQFTASAWQSRPDGQPVDDHRPRRARSATPGARPQRLPRSTPRGPTLPTRDARLHERLGRLRAARRAAPQRRAGLRRALARARVRHGGGAVRARDRPPGRSSGRR